MITEICGGENPMDANAVSLELPSRAPSDAAIEDAGRLIFEARRIRDSLPVEDAARRAVRPGGPSYEELVEKIRAQRAHWPARAVA